MNFVKSINKKKLLAILAAPILILLSVLLTGCYPFQYTMIMWNYDIKYHINRIIYTDNVAKYTLGKEIAPFEDPNISLTKIDNLDMVAVYQNKKDKIVDLVIDSTVSPYTYNTHDYTIGMVDDLLPDTVDPFYAFIGFDSSHIFSGVNASYLVADAENVYDPTCGSGSCTCGVTDKNCSCNSSPAPADYVSDHVLTANEVYELIVPGCTECWGYRESNYTVNGDGTYSYHAQNICSHNPVVLGSVPTSLLKVYASLFDFAKMSNDTSSAIKREDYVLSSHTFDELVIDGFDFSRFYDKLTTYDFDRLYGEFIGDKYKPNDFSHMFSDLPVKKITILNATGLAGKVDDMSGMFENCTNLTTVEFGNLFEGVQPTNIRNMFRNCPKLQSVDLSSLDTSKVTDMSNMFTNFDNRDEHLQYFINNVIVPTLHPELMQDRPYTEQTFLQAVGKTSMLEYQSGIGANVVIAEEVTVPYTYEELSQYSMNATMDEVLTMANADRVNFRENSLVSTYWERLFSDRADDQPITMKELQYLVGCIAYEKVGLTTIVTEEELLDMYEVTKLDGVPATVIHNDVYGFADRDEYLESVINDELIPTHIPELNDGTHYTVEAFVTKLGITPLDGLIELHKLGYFIPFTCDEAYQLQKKENPSAPESQFDTIEEMGKYYNDMNVTNPSGDYAAYFPPKADGSAYTDLEVAQILLKYAGTTGMFKTNVGIASAAVYTPEEMDALFSAEPAVTFSILHNPIVLTLGCSDSKFVINADTNVTNMLGNHAKFASIQLPVIAEGVQIALPQEYIVDNRVVLSNIDSGISNKTINYKTSDFVPEPLPPEIPTSTNQADTKDNSWSKTNTIIILSVVGFALVAIMVITTLMGIRKSRKEK